MNNPILRNAVVTIASFVFVISVVSAWTAPTGVPPTNNVSAPINVGGDQIKTGALQVAALKSLGGIQAGNTTATCDATLAGSIRWTGTAFEGCNGTAWGPLAVGGTGGGNSSLYCAYLGKSTSVSFNDPYTYPFVIASCSISVDATGFERISVSDSSFGTCNASLDNNDTVSCTATDPGVMGEGGMYGGGSITVTASFNRSSGQLTCTYLMSNNYTGTKSALLPKDASKCSI